MNDRELREISQEDALRLLSAVPIGRIVFTRHALPAVRPVNHIVDEWGIVIRSNLGTTISSEVAPYGAVVAYEVDSMDPERRIGWSVVVTGVAGLVEDPVEIARYRELLRPWVPGDMDQVIRIRPEIITGFEIVDEDGISLAQAALDMFDTTDITG